MPSPTKSPTDKKSPKATLKAPPAKPATTAKEAAAPAPKAAKISRPAANMTTAADRHQLIAEAAYYRAEQRAFQGGSPEQDWFEAAAQIDKMFMERK